MRLFLVIFAVEALAASWIEISAMGFESVFVTVEALAASWIEIPFVPIIEYYAQKSKPLRLRGLKLLLSVQDGQ